jgi:hypothetical protein
MNILLGYLPCRAVPVGCVRFVYVLLNPLRLLVTVNVPFCSADTLIQ